MRYGEGLIAEILRRTDLVQLVGRRVRLERRGRAFWGLCPFHKEKSPSFKVEHERRNYKCFGCGAGGDAFKWLMETEGLHFPEAVERLAQEAGVELPKWTPQDETREQQKKALYTIIEDACVFFEQQLRAPGGTVARAYLFSRGLNEDTWRKFRLGYAPSGRNALVTCLKANGAPTEDIVAAGLARAADGEPARDFFFDRVIFPIGDLRDRVVAFGARALRDDAKPKYLNTGETPLFSKGRLLYNFASARAAALKSGALVVAEGYLDVIALAGAGFEGAVAPLGTAITSDQLSLLWRVSAEPILSFDGDGAGARAAARAAELALPLLAPGHSLRFALLPSDEDPDSLIRTQGAEAMRSALEKAMPLADLLWKSETEGRNFDSPERKAALVSSLNEKLKLIASGDVRRFYLDTMSDKIARQFGVVTYVRGDQIQASGKPFRQSKPGRGIPAARSGTGAVSSALMASRLVSLAGGKRAQGSSGIDPEGIRLVRAPPPVAPRQSAADGCGDSGQGDNSAARRMKEAELFKLLIEVPEILDRCHETLAVLPLTDASLDRLRHELLNVAASGFSLETGRLEDHLVRAGMAALVKRLKAQRAGDSVESGPARKNADGGETHAAEIEARWLCAAAQLREMAEGGPERRQALERLKSEASVESWCDLNRLHPSRMHPSE